MVGKYLLCTKVVCVHWKYNYGANESQVPPIFIVLKGKFANFTPWCQFTQYGKFSAFENGYIILFVKLTELCFCQVFLGDFFAFVNIVERRNDGGRRGMASSRGHQPDSNQGSCVTWSVTWCLGHRVSEPMIPSGFFSNRRYLKLCYLDLTICLLGRFI